MKNFWTYGELPMGLYPPNSETQFSSRDLDNENHFRTLKPSNRWSADSFTYKFNSHGFRSREFDINRKEPLLLAFGCSHTSGVGVPVEDNWPEQLGSEYFPNHVVYNAGQGGGSCDTVARLAVNMIPILKPDIVTILWPNLNRFESYDGLEEPEFHGPWSDDVFATDNEAYNNQQKNKVILDLLQEIYKFTLLSLDMESMPSFFNDNRFTCGRDQQHNGPDWHEWVSKEFYSQYLKTK